MPQVVHEMDLDSFLMQSPWVILWCSGLEFTSHLLFTETLAIGTYAIQHRKLSTHFSDVIITVVKWFTPVWFPQVPAKVVDHKCYSDNN